MTGFLASVATVEEMAAVRSHADIVDLKDPSQGALGAWGNQALREGVAVWRGWHEPKPRLSATIGDQPMDPQVVRTVAEQVAATGVPLVKLGLFPGGDARGCLRALAPLARTTRLIAVFFGDDAPDFSQLDDVAAAGFHGAMIDTTDKAAGGLRGHLDDAALCAFVGRAKALRLLTGLAGSLRLDDVAPLARLRPDYLGFRGALCNGGRAGRLDPLAIARIAGELSGSDQSKRDHAAAPAASRVHST